MASVKISVTVDDDVLREVKDFVGADVSLSAIVNDGLRLQAQRLRMVSLLDEMDERKPISAAGRVKGEELWRAIESSLIQGRSRRSRAKTKESV